MNKPRFYGLASLLILTIGVLFISWVYKGSYKSPQEAQQQCGNIVWVIERDSPFHNVFEKDLTDEVSINYLQSLPSEGQRTLTCTASSADNIVRFEKILTFSIYIFFLPIWLPLLLVGIVIWWLFKELKRYGRKHKAK